MNDTSGQIGAAGTKLNGLPSIPLANLNDEGFTFEQIADVIDYFAVDL